MKEKKYLNIIQHYENCQDEFGDTFKGADWPNDVDALARYKVMLDVIKENEEVTLLDFGCGTGLMYQYLLDHKDLYSKVNYSGLEISNKIISKSKLKYPDVPFYSFDILDYDLSSFKNFDYAILNGVFTEKINLTSHEMWDYFQKLITVIFSKVDKGIAFNVMSKAVDWERDDLFHVSTDTLINFMTKKLSRNFVIRNDYGLFEYTVYLYK